MAWLPNQGGGQFGPVLPVTQEVDGVETLDAVDLDGDGDLDLISPPSTTTQVAWYENQGAGVFGQQQPLPGVIDGATAAAAADLDGDGDLDIALSGFFDDVVGWSENLDGQGDFAAQP